MKKLLTFLLLSTTIATSCVAVLNHTNNETNRINKNNEVKNADATWLDEVEAPGEYDYSFAVIGDIQNLSFKYPSEVATVYNYVVDNIESQKIEHVFSLGDITEGSSEKEWINAQKAISVLDGKIDYSMVRGNHDGKEQYLKYFGNTSGYANQYKASYLSSLNTVVEFSAGNLDYLVVNLDYLPNDDILTWANSVVEAHPYHNVIVTTHAYINADGSKYVPTSGNGGAELWDKFIKKHANITMVLCGHIDDENLEAIKTTGENGNVVTELLIDPQNTDLLFDGGVGLVAMLYFSNDGKNVELRYYSTIKKQYYKANNQFSFEVNTISRENITQ